MTSFDQEILKYGQIYFSNIRNWLFFEEIILLVEGNRKVRYCNKDVKHYFGSDHKLFQQDDVEGHRQKELQISPYLYDLAQTAASDKTRYQNYFCQ